MAAGVDGLENPIALVGACYRPVRQLREPQADGIAFLDGKIAGGGCEDPVEPNAAIVDGHVLELIAALGFRQMFKLWRLPDGPRGDDVSLAALVKQRELCRIFVPEQGCAAVALTLAFTARSWPRDFQHRFSGCRVLPIGQAECMREQIEFGRVAIG